MISAIGSAELAGSKSPKRITISANDMRWESIEVSERSMGKETTWRGSPASGSFTFLSWTVYEYPAGTVSHVEHDFGKLSLVKDFEFTFT